MNSLYKRILIVFVIFCGIFSAISTTFATDELLSSDPQREEVSQLVRSGQQLMHKGEREISQNPGRSFEYFEKAEKMFQRASNIYKELGEKYNIRVVNEIKKCNSLASKAHVRKGKARREKKSQYIGIL